jgi:thiol-disulfide isomerase/thioredoxin
MKRKLCFLESPCPSDKPILGTIGTVVGIIVIFLFSNVSAYPQNGLSIGDKVPEVSLTNIIHYRTGQAKLSDFKGKLIILDFWATWCAPCVASLSKTDSLQKIFDGRAQLLPVTYQSKDETEKVLARIEKRKGKKLSLPMVVADKELQLLFPHHTLPHYVWINAEGIVIAITGIEEVSAANIEAALQKQTLSMDTKKDVMVAYDKNSPLVSGNTQLLNKPLLYQTALFGHIEGLPAEYNIFATNSVSGKRITATNVTLLWLYKVAWSEAIRYIHPDKIVLEVKDPSALHTGQTGKAEAQWLREHTYGYEIIVPATMEGQLYKIMQQDLQKLFPQYSASIEKRKIKCLALVRTSSTDKLKSRNEKTSMVFEGGSCQLKNSFLQSFILQLNAVYLQYLPTPLIDLTGYNNKVDMILNCDLSDTKSLKDALKTYDLDLVERETTVEVLVIKDTQ